MSKSDTEKALGILKAQGLITSFGDSWWRRSPVRAVEEIWKMQENTNAVMKMNIFDLIWEERIVNNFGNGFYISIQTNASYPFSMPVVRVLEPQIEPESIPHYYANKTLCLLHPDAYNPTMSVLDFRNLAGAWCLCYDVFKETGEWPAAEHDHSED